MPAGLITLPLRLGIRGAQLALGLSERAVGMAWHAVESFVPGHDGGSSASAPSHEAQRPFARERESGNGRATDDGVAHDPRAEFERGDQRVRSREAPPEPEVREPAGHPEPATPAEPEHIDTESTLVESFAEPGAEDGAGAQVRIEEPWEGYGAMTATDVIARLEQASPEELAAIELFEATSKQRATVLTAVERQLKARTAGTERSGGSAG